MQLTSMDRRSRPRSVTDAPPPGFEPSSRRARETPPRPRVSFDRAREFIIRAESILMLPNERVSDYLSRVDQDVFQLNTVIDLQDQDRCFIAWSGLRRELQVRISLLHHYSYGEFVEELRYCEAELIEERGRRWARERFHPNPLVRRRQTRDFFSRYRQRTTQEMEEHPVPLCYRCRYMEVPEGQDETSTNVKSDEDPTEYPDEDEANEATQEEAPQSAQRCDE